MRTLHHGRATRERESDRWLTPLPLIRSLGRFDLDPCGAPGHQTADEVWTPKSIVDGMCLSWRGRVWLNPPYGRVATAWMRKLVEHGDGVALLFARTDTDLFHDWVFPHADAMLFLHGRVRFLTPDRQYADRTSGAPSVLIAYGKHNADALKRSGLDGSLR